MELLGLPGDTVEDADIPGGKASNPIDDSALDPRREVGEAGVPEVPDILLAGNWAELLERRYDPQYWYVVEAGFCFWVEPGFDGPEAGCTRCSGTHCSYVL